MPTYWLIFPVPNPLITFQRFMRLPCCGTAAPIGARNQLSLQGNSKSCFDDICHDSRHREPRAVPSAHWEPVAQVEGHVLGFTVVSVHLNPSFSHWLRKVNLDLYQPQSILHRSHAGSEMREEERSGRGDFVLFYFFYVAMFTGHMWIA